MKTELKQIIRELSEVIVDERLNILDKDKLDFALKLYITESIGKQKQFYPKTNYPKNEFRNDFKTSPLTKSEEKPTEAQIKACKKLNLPIPAGSSKKDVWKIMNENKK